MRDPLQLLYWRFTWPTYLSLSLSTSELEVWVGDRYARLLWRNPETDAFSLWLAHGRWGQQAAFNAAEQAKFQAVQGA